MRLVSWKLVVLAGGWWWICPETTGALSPRPKLHNARVARSPIRPCEHTNDEPCVCVFFLPDEGTGHASILIHVITKTIPSKHTKAITKAIISSKQRTTTTSHKNKGNPNGRPHATRTRLFYSIGSVWLASSVGQRQTGSGSETGVSCRNRHRHTARIF